MKLGLKVGLALLAIWAIAAIGILAGRSLQPTPEKIAAYIAKHPLDAQSESQRAKTLEAVAERLNGLDFEQREKLRRTGATEKFYRSLSPDEQSKFLDLTLPAGFRQMMQAFNKMKPEKRREFVNNAVKRMQEARERGEMNHPAGAPTPNPEQMNRIVQQGMKAFYEEADAGTKLDFAPLIEQMQQTIGQFR